MCLMKQIISMTILYLVALSYYFPHTLHSSIEVATHCFHVLKGTSVHALPSKSY